MSKNKQVPNTKQHRQLEKARRLYLRSLEAGGENYQKLLRRRATLLQATSNRPK